MTLKERDELLSTLELCHLWLQGIYTSLVVFGPLVAGPSAEVLVKINSSILLLRMMEVD